MQMPLPSDFNRTWRPQNAGITATPAHQLGHFVHVCVCGTEVHRRRANGGGREKRQDPTSSRVTFERGDKMGTGTKSSAPHFGAAVDAVYSPTEAAAEVLTTAAHTLTCTEKNL